MKNAILLIFCLISNISIYATEQESDLLYYKNQKLDLNTGWGYPSPLETYYSQNKITYPFTMLSTSNYRGHIAVWEIEDNKLFLKEIRIEDTTYTPEKFNIKSKTDSLSRKDKLFADWFSGVIVCELRDKKDYWKIEMSYLFHVKNGIVINTQLVTDEDFKRIEKMSDKDTSDHELIAKHNMLKLTRNYISYYYRHEGNDTITYENNYGLLSGNSGLSPVLLLYLNDHTKWPYNWENSKKNGIPNCNWAIIGNKLYLRKIYLQSKTGLYLLERDSVDLNELFHGKMENNKVLGYWISGIYIIKQGENVEVKSFPAYIEFKISGYTYLRIYNGIIKEKYTVSSDFDFKNIPKDTHPGLKKMLNELK